MPHDILEQLNVSRETMGCLKHYAELLVQWTKHINLIAPSTVPDVWTRHILDSAQLYRYIQPQQSIVDLGSGAGLPGLVLALMGCQNVHLIESDGRKCTFLKEASRLCGIADVVTIHQKRIEICPPLYCDVVVSRACAPLIELLDYAERHRSDQGKCIFLKGKHLLEEINVAALWKLNYTSHSSLTDPNAVIVEITQMEKLYD